MDGASDPGGGSGGWVCGAGAGPDSDPDAVGHPAHRIADADGHARPERRARRSCSRSTRRARCAPTTARARRKIDAAKEARGGAAETLPDSTEVGLRLFGGTRPSRPIDAACEDSSLVLPLGRVDRGEAEGKIRSFKARGRTPIAYALEQAAKDLGDSGSRTIVLVSDGKDTCSRRRRVTSPRRSPRAASSCDPGDRFRVDEEARQELECIAAAGGGVYRDATDAASLRQELRVLSTRALREYVARGAATKGGPSARTATVLKPGRYVDKFLPDSERWYAIDLARGETLKASASFIAPERKIENYGADSALDIVTPDFDIPSTRTRPRPGAVRPPRVRRRARRRLAPDRRRRAGRGLPAVLQARPLLPQGRLRRLGARRRSST